MARSEKPAIDLFVDLDRGKIPRKGMRTTILTLTAALVLTGGLWLRAQRSDEGSTGTLTGSQEGKTAMDEQCRHMCATQYNPESPGSLLAWKQELNLTDDQAASLRTVEEKAIGDAKALLTADQLGKLKELAQDMKPQSMMQFMQGMKGKMGDAMPMCCSTMHSKAKH
jgi:hypothetical protein